MQNLRVVHSFPSVKNKAAPYYKTRKHIREAYNFDGDNNQSQPLKDFTMKLTSANLFAAALGAAGVAQAVTNTTFGFGFGYANYTTHSNNAVWVYGENSCDYTYMGIESVTECEFRDGWFELGGEWYQFTGCGHGLGNFCMYNEDHSKVSCPTWNIKIPQAEGCSDDHGDFFTMRYFIF